MLPGLIASTGVDPGIGEDGLEKGQVYFTSEHLGGALARMHQTGTLKDIQNDPQRRRREGGSLIL